MNLRKWFKEVVFEMDSTRKCTNCDPQSNIPHETKTLRLRIANMCCAGEERVVREVLSEFSGIESISVNVIGRSAVVKHCSLPCCAPASVIVDNLNQRELGVSIQESLEEELTDNNEIPKIMIVHAVMTTAVFILASVYLALENVTPIGGYLFCFCAAFGSIPISYRAYEAICRKQIDINVLVIVAVIGSITGGQYKDGALVVTLFVLAKLLEEVILQYVRGAIKLSSSGVGRYALLVRPGKEATQVLVDDLKPGDVIAVRTGDIIPVDGVVLAGNATVNESAITGEAEFLSKAPGAAVLSGSLVQNGYLEVEGKTAARDSLMRKLNDTVNDVQASKGEIATIVDSFAAYWVPGIVFGAIGLITVGGFLTGEWREYMNKGLTLMILACPCSIVLSAPIVTLCGIAHAAKHGVVIKGLLNLPARFIGDSDFFIQDQK
jgi:cation transport ATPase